MEQSEVRNLVRSWHQRARREREPVARFVFLWFCFNAWLAYESGEDGDRRMIEWLKDARPDTSQLRAAYEIAATAETSLFSGYLSNLAKLSPIGRTGRREGEEVRIESPDDFSAILEGIYVVRCNLFHGAKRANSVRDEKLVRVCGSIMEKWVGNLVGNWRRAAGDRARRS